MTQSKIIVLDDDPTGSQTVHSCLLLTRWDIDTLKQALLDKAPLFFILTNTRGMGASEAALLTREVCINLRHALNQLRTDGIKINSMLVSRSDSTLRGHYPVETDVIANELGPFDALFLIPAFFEGGRITRDSVHYLIVNGKPVPVSETEFAHDSVFPYSTAYLPGYVEEKTQGRISATQVQRFLLEDVRGNTLQRLLSLNNNTCCVVDAESQADLNHFCEQLIQATHQGKHFLFRSAASLLTALADLPAQPIAAQSMSAYVRNGNPGAVIVGSHVKKTTQQLNQLLKQPGISAIEVDVDQIGGNKIQLQSSVTSAAHKAFEQKQTAVIYTSRSEKSFVNETQRLAFGCRVSSFLMDVVRSLPDGIGFLISKGGITSNDVLSDALALTTARVLGQIHPGCSVVRCPENHARFPNLPVVIFPGNVGDENSLATVYNRLAANEPNSDT